MSQITVNATDLEIRRMREDMLRVAGSIDGKRPNSWEQYGYPEVVTFDLMYRAYERGGAGQGAVHRILDGCWQQLPRIKSPASDKETPFERKVSALFKSLKLWAKLKDFDRRNLIGRYAGLIYRLADNQPLREPAVRASKLVDVIPVFESQLRVTDWDSDPSSPTFGEPRMYQYRSRVEAGDTQGKPDQWADVHPSRVQIFAEGAVGDMFDGVPLLRAGFNALIDLEKISGGSAESFLKNSARTIVFKYDVGASVQAITQADGSKKTVREVHEEQTRSLNRNQDSSIVIQGGDASTLQTAIADPSKPFETAACLFAASVRLPFTVLFGQQTGRLASDEDNKSALARYKSRQTNELTPMIEEFVRRMQAFGVIEQGEFEIEWPPVDAPGDKEQADLLDKLTTAMERAFRAGVPNLFEADELRRVAGYEAQQVQDLPVDGDPEPVE